MSKKELKAMRKISWWNCLTILLCAILFSYGTGAFAEEPGWAERLSQVEGVLSVEPIPLNASAQFFSEKYLVVFEQPLDWDHPEKGVFPQRVEIGLKEDAQTTVLETNGYALPDQYPGATGTLAELGRDDATEIAQLFGANYVNVEHRFFGKSRPADMSNGDTRYWEYHTAENAAKDYHRIYLALSPLLGDAWAATGSSRGGEMTNVYAYFFPEDMRCFVPYVAPCSMGPEDPRFYTFLYTEIGNEAFGPEQAESMRNLILDFQVELMKNKAALLPVFETMALQAMNCVFQGQVPIDQVYDLNVLEFAVQFWQYQSISFDVLRAILDMPESTPEEALEKAQTEFNLLLQVQAPADWSSNFMAWPYYVNAATTYGQYHYDFTYLRQALAAAGMEDTLSVTEDMEDGLLWRLVFTEAQREAFAYDGSFAASLAAFEETTGAKILMVFGASDPWISLRIPETSNPNVAVFVHPTAPHSANISSMPEGIRSEAVGILKGWLQ